MEENGMVFRDSFIRETTQERVLESLPPPWNDLTMSLLDDWEATTHHTAAQDESSDPVEKRTVLLCFNENVRSAEDVWRCHNEFIRDAAHAAGLALTAEEWRIFFAGEEGSGTSTPSSGSPRFRPGAGEGLAPPLQLPSGEWTSASRTNTMETQSIELPVDEDVFGTLTPTELNKFRTTWCAKRYDHDWSTCGFAHVDINRGWLRRDPTHHTYSSKLCPDIHPVEDQGACLVNACPRGVNCPYAHSQEELQYHPSQYKRHICPSTGRYTCTLKSVCPNRHPPSNPQSPAPSAPIHSSPRTPLPCGAPMMYISPSPESDFDKSLMLPGLRGLFRRRCSTIHAARGGRTCVYNHFGDDCGVGRAEDVTKRGRGRFPGR
eukprot:CAMPEP_0172489650 /NCGR_PEP_ID=MMETSP1066-20121228/19813_1 /TAXON_ID=671091 /ORGANISM="Coscinodiscus wailesii, Strain CCMP2513" /LENGTH=375 /DNA_ID=CAMNT_0013257681 /DNA_START=1513 /DNA_END=2640 /DNA_ORIENTATION=+